MKRILILLYEYIIFTPIFVVATIMTAITVMIGCALGNRRYWANNPPRQWSKFTCKLSLCKVSVIQKGKLDPHKSYIFVPNHQSYFDIFLIYGYIGHNVKWVQKYALRKIPSVGKASEIAGHVFVDQSSVKSIEKTVRKAKEQLEKEASIVIFAEGSRTPNGRIARFKRGAFLIAKQMNLDIVPVTVNGAYEVMRKGAKSLTPGKMELVIHEPISTKDLKDEDMQQLMDQCKKTIETSLWEQYQSEK